MLYIGFLLSVCVWRVRLAVCLSPHVSILDLSSIFPIFFHRVSVDRFLCLSFCLFVYLYFVHSRTHTHTHSFRTVNQMACASDLMATATAHATTQ